MTSRAYSINPPIGLYNGGATCWLNSICQAIVSLDPLMHIIDTHLRETNDSARNCAYIMLHTMATRMFRIQITRNATIEHCTFATLPFANWSSILYAINCRSIPAQYYDGSFARDACITNAREFFVSCPLAHIALAFASHDRCAGVYLFCALVLHCALVGVRPLPEYGSIGEVSPSIIDLIIGALDVETNRDIMESIADSDNAVHQLFAIHSQSVTLCARHIGLLSSILVTSHATDVSHCISIVPTADAREFVMQVRASIDLSERKCQAPSCTCACACANIMVRERLPRILTIMTDDQTARGITNSTSTQVYRRSPIGTIAVPEAFDVEDTNTHNVSTYTLVAQIIQEGGHFVTLIRHACASQHETSRAWYASDMSITEHDAQSYSPGTVALFYVAHMGCIIDSRAPIDMRTIARAYISLHDSSRQVVSACGQSWQRLTPHVTIDRAQHNQQLDNELTRALYDSMSNTQRILARDHNASLAHHVVTCAVSPLSSPTHAGVIYPTRVARMVHHSHMRT